MDKRFDLYLTRKEEDIMGVLWDSQVPLTVSGICDNAEEAGLSLNQSTVQMTVNKLMKKGILRIGDYTQTHKSVARAFEPVLNADEYAIKTIKTIMDGAGKQKKTTYIAALLDDEDLSETDLDLLTTKIEGMRQK